MVPLSQEEEDQSHCVVQKRRVPGRPWYGEWVMLVRVWILKLHRQRFWFLTLRCKMSNRHTSCLKGRLASG